MKIGKFFKRLKIPNKHKTFLLVVLLAIGGSMFHNTISYAKSTAGSYAWRDDMGNIIIQTEDHQRTSSVCYDTVGWTITRCILGTKTPVEEQYITVKYTGSLEDVPIGNSGYTTSAYTIPESKILTMIAAASPEWYADIVSGETCYLKIDAIMVTKDYAQSPLSHISGMLLSEKNQNYFYNHYYPNPPGPGVYDKFTKDDLKYHTYGWYSPESIDTHFDKYILYNGGELEEPEENDEYVITIGKTKPEYYTWNTSDEFDLSEGIPSGEDVTNGYGADKWFGRVVIGKHEEERSYVIPYILKYTDSDGDEQVVPWSATVKRKASYYYAQGIDIYELKQVDVGNSIYSADVLEHTPDVHTWILSGNEVDVQTELDGVANPVEVDDWTSDVDAHVIFPEQPGTIEIDCGEGIASVDAMINHLNEVLYDDVITNEDPVKEVISWNDLVEIDGIKYLDNTHVKHAYDTSYVRIPYENERVMTNGKDDALYLFHEKQVVDTIPKDVANGSYATAMEVQYIRRALADDKILTFDTMSNNDSIYNHLKPGYEKNEPVFVHTPVISPVSIKDGEEGTQLITENKTDYVGMVDKDGRVPDGKAIYELILDNEYTFKFDPELHREIQGYGWSGDPSKYDKYVKGKYVAFPFTVRLQIDGQWTEFYDIDNSTVDAEGNEKLAGYTQWIEIPNNETTFYIPSWAIEGIYYEIQYRVEAYNMLDENGQDHYDDTEGTANTTLNEDHEAINYVATYVVPVELSGIIYNFEVIGTNFYEDYNPDIESGAIALCPRKWEKKQGNRNRTGGTSVRYTLDGDITTNWEDVNTLPFGMGTSNVWSERGYLVSGDVITFSVKTIANLWDEGTDYVYITPTFRWYDYDGTLHDDIQVYYWDDTNKYQPIRYGSERDKNEAKLIEKESDVINRFSFQSVNVAGSAWDRPYTMDNNSTRLFSTSESDFQGDYHDEDLFYTINWHNRHYADEWTLASFLMHDNMSYCLSFIKLNSNMRTLTGNWEELKYNIDNPRGTCEEFVLDEETEDRFKYSMQTWYGQYQIPTDMLICDADTFSNMGITDQDGDGVIDYLDYLIQTGDVIDKHADFWLNQDYNSGYLLLNFDIKTYNNGKPHLTYYGSALDMWQQQGAKQTTTIGDPTLDYATGGKYPVTDIPLQSGDIAIIDTKESVYDGRVPGIFMIN